MEIEQTAADQLLAESRRQTAALESMRGIALFWTVFGLLAAVVVLITAVNAGF